MHTSIRSTLIDYSILPTWSHFDSTYPNYFTKKRYFYNGVHMLDDVYTPYGWAVRDITISPQMDAVATMCRLRNLPVDYSVHASQVYAPKDSWRGLYPTLVCYTLTDNVKWLTFWGIIRDSVPHRRYIHMDEYKEILDNDTHILWLAQRKKKLHTRIDKLYKQQSHTGQAITKAEWDLLFAVKYMDYLQSSRL